jgi:DNA-binding NtrC family response regulator
MVKDVLIVDDEEWFVEPILDRLDFENISYDFCTNGSEAMKLLQSTGYKSVILDIKVSLGDDYQDTVGSDFPGIFLLGEMKKKNPGLPVLCYTMLTDHEVVTKIRQLGGIHIAKGSGDQSLFEEIKRVIIEKV